MKNLSYILFTLLITSCVPGKKIKGGASLGYDASNSNITVNGQDKLIHKSGDMVKAEFLEELTSSLDYHNISVNEIDSDFTLLITSIEYIESSHIETVNDVSSPDNGTSFTLYELSFTASFELWQNRTLIESWTDYTNAEDDLTSNRSFWQSIFGANKNSDQYRVKEVNWDKALNKSARQTGRKISRLVHRHRKRKK